MSSNWRHGKWTSAFAVSECSDQWQQFGEQVFYGQLLGGIKHHETIWNPEKTSSHNVRIMSHIFRPHYISLYSHIVWLFLGCWVGSKRCTIDLRFGLHWDLCRSFAPLRSGVCQWFHHWGAAGWFLCLPKHLQLSALNGFEFQHGTTRKSLGRHDRPRLVADVRCV